MHFFSWNAITAKAQDYIEIDSTGVTINGHYLSIPARDTMNNMYSVKNFRTIIKRPYKYNGRSNANEAIVKNKRRSRFLADYSYIDDSKANIIQIEQVYYSKKTIIVKVLDLEINSNTTYRDIMDSKLMKSYTEHNNAKGVTIKPYFFYFRNVFGAKVDMLINVTDNPRDRILNVWIYFKGLHNIPSPTW